MEWNVPARYVPCLMPKKPGIPIVAITGNAKNYSMEDFKKAGITDYLQKPLDFDKLVSVVKELTA